VFPINQDWPAHGGARESKRAAYGSLGGKSKRLLHAMLPG